MRITWFSNAPWAGTGYGTQTAEVTRRLAAAGHEVAIANNYGHTGSPGATWHGMPVFPAGIDQFGNDVLAAHHVYWLSGDYDGRGPGDGWIITLYDVWGFKPETYAKLHIASWVPIDHLNVPPRIVSWTEGHETIAMSRFGQTALKRAGVEATYIPHAIDRSVFRPHPKFETRERLGMPADAFIVMINAANKGNQPVRKAFPQMFVALGVFMASHPDVHLYLHTDRYGVGGIDLAYWASIAGLPGDRIHFVDQYAYKIGAVTQEDLALTYSAADVLLATSLGEGFGIPVIEAQACGTPVIVSNGTAQPELVGGGWLVDIQPEPDPVQGQWWHMPIQSSILRRLEEAYRSRGDEDIAAVAVAKAAEYDVDKVFTENWLPYIAKLERALERPATPPRGPNRAQRRSKRRAA